MRWRIRIGAGLAVLLLLLALAEVTARVAWRVCCGFSPRSGRGFATAFYPELVRPLQVAPSRTDSIIDVLLLGGSTMSREFGSVGPALQERLSLATGRRVRVVNLGVPARSSLDTYYRYRSLAPVGFDAVVLYDGFNETRANNAPPEVFRDDYSHYAYYALLHGVLRDGRLRPFALPYSLAYLARRARERESAARGHPLRVPMERIDSTWTAYGSDIRTPGPFRRNVEATLDLAAARGEPAIIMTFAAYFAPGYSEAAFRAHKLDYADHTNAIELWGRPVAVAAALEAHNAEIRAIARVRPGIGFVDMDAAIPHDRLHFNDVCHLTVAGSQRFADALFPKVMEAIGWKAAATGRERAVSDSAMWEPSGGSNRRGSVPRR